MSGYDPNRGNTVELTATEVLSHTELKLSPEDFVEPVEIRLSASNERAPRLQVFRTKNLEKGSSGAPHLYTGDHEVVRSFNHTKPLHKHSIDPQAEYVVVSLSDASPGLDAPGIVAIYPDENGGYNNVIIGREPQYSFLSLRDDDTVSRQHVTLSLGKKGELTIRDHSSNGTVVKYTPGSTWDDLRSATVSPEMAEQQMQLEKSFRAPTGKEREERWRVLKGENRESARRIAEEVYRFAAEDIKEIFKRYKDDNHWHRSHMAELLRENDELRSELGFHLHNKLKETEYLPSRFYRPEIMKSPSHPGYESHMDSREYTVMLALSMLDGTFDYERVKNDPIVTHDNGEISGQHRYVALKILGLATSQYNEWVNRKLPPSVSPLAPNRVERLAESPSEELPSLVPAPDESEKTTTASQPLPPLTPYRQEEQPSKVNETAPSEEKKSFIGEEVRSIMGRLLTGRGLAVGFVASELQNATNALDAHNSSQLSETLGKIGESAGDLLGLIEADLDGLKNALKPDVIDNETRNLLDESQEKYKEVLKELDALLNNAKSEALNLGDYILQAGLRARISCIENLIRHIRTLDGELSSRLNQVHRQE